MAVGLAWLSVILIVGEWLILLPLFGMGLVDASRLYRLLWLAAFFGWPIAASSAAFAASSLRRRPRRAAGLLIPSIAALAYPLSFLAPLTLVAATLALLSSKTQGHTEKAALPQ